MTENPSYPVPLRAVARALALFMCVLTGCADSTQGAWSPNTSTETGNPPLLDSELIALVVWQDMAVIIGKPGAVSPGGSEVEVEVVGTGETHRGTANPDGSFEIPFEGDGPRIYAVRTVGADAGVSTAPVYVYRGGAQVGGADDEAFSCGVRDEVIEGVLDAAINGAEFSCTEDSDCVRAPALDGCYHEAWTCGQPVVSQRGAERLQAAVESLQGSFCDGYEAQGCGASMPPVSCPEAGAILCDAGRCVEARGAQLTCAARDEVIEAVLSPAVDAADRSCEQDSDCTYAPTPGECFHDAFLCGPPPVSLAGAQQIRGALLELEDRGICEGYSDQKCWEGKPVAGCPAPIGGGPARLACDAGRCKLCGEACPGEL